MSFDANEHLILLGKKQYLETKWRLVWFREEHPQGCIATEVVSYDPVLVKATIFSSENTVLATAHAGATDKGNAVWSGRTVEKAETAAIGRALGHAGYGTQFIDDDEAESGHLADSPVDRKQAAQKLGNGGERRAVGGNAVTDRNKDEWQIIFKRVELFFTEEDEAGRKAHWWNLVQKLQREGVITNAMQVPEVVEIIAADRQVKTA